MSTRPVIAGLGGLFLTIAVSRTILQLAAERPLGLVVAMEVIIGLPGVGLLYGAYRLPSTNLRQDVYPCIKARCLAGIGVMLGVVLLLAVSGLNRPFYTPFAATALGAVAGFAIGYNEAKALSRARDAEHAQQDLERTVQHLEASNKRLEEFTYAASHDLQEPLRMVSSYLQLLENEYEEELDAEAREYIDYAVDGADRMRAMVESLLNYSRVTRQGQPLEPTNTEEILEDVLLDLEPRIEETSATVTVDELPTVPADADQLAQVFRNLISNALAYSGDVPPEVHIGAEQVEGEWQFVVADEGVGIDPEHHDRIFKSFERLNTQEEVSGTGIGLALCKRIIERHHGEIWVESEPGDGARFYFTLPTTEGETEFGSFGRRDQIAL